jgi:hypothetical protein
MGFLAVTPSQDSCVIMAIYTSQGHPMYYLWRPACTGMTGILLFARKRKSEKSFADNRAPYIGQ